MKKSELYSFESIWSHSGLKEFIQKEGKFTSYYAPFCIYPLSSPVFGKGKFSEEDIESLEFHFKKKRKGQKPFILFEGKVDLKNWEKKGYQAREMNVCYLSKCSKKPELPKGFSFEVIKFSTLKGKNIYREVACSVFGLDEKFLTGFHKLCEKMSPSNYLIVVYNPGKVPVACAGVACFKKVCFLHSVCVLLRYQGKGISNWLMSKALNIASPLKSKSLIYTSSNMRMIGQANSVKNLIYIYQT